MAKLTELPTPPNGKKGWPWTEESKVYSQDINNNQLLPKISIVTPSYNQGQFIEETIRSVLLQNYPNLEYIIIDGGSNDETIEIIKKYEQWITYWVSEKDNGQAHAINKGFKRSTGEIVAWLNSDDVYYTNTLNHVAFKYINTTKKNRFWFILGVDFIDFESGEKITAYQGEFYQMKDWTHGNANPNQQGTFWAKKIFLDFGYLIENMHYVFDKEYFMRLISHGVFFERSFDTVAGCYRMHEQCKWKSQWFGFKYEWAKLTLLYVKNDPVIIKSSHDEIIHSLIRMAQDNQFGTKKKLSKLFEAVKLRPTCMFQRDYLGTLKKVLFNTNQ